MPPLAVPAETLYPYFVSSDDGYDKAKFFSRQPGPFYAAVEFFVKRWWRTPRPYWPVVAYVYDEKGNQVGQYQQRHLTPYIYKRGGDVTRARVARTAALLRRRFAVS